MPLGIEKINLYAGRFYLDLADLAKARGQDPQYIATNLMCEQRSVYPVWEDAVTLAVNAAKKLLSPEDIEDIELLIVGTESAVDMGKPISTWVHRFCNLSPNCRNFEVKHACYSSTGAFKMAASWVASGSRPGKKALVINTDFSRNFVGTEHEPIGGGCAVAFLVSENPQILEIELDKAGYWTNEIADTFRPTSRTETVNGQISIYSYLDALEGAYEHYEQIAGKVDYDADFKKHIYHAPFPGMTFQAHRDIVSRLTAPNKATIPLNFQQKVAESLYFAKRIGSCYGGSNFVCLLGLLTSAENLNPGDRISLFAYGSGCQGEFYSGTIGAAASEMVRSLNLDQHLNERLRLSVEEYELIESAREKYIDCPDYEPDRNTLNGYYEKLYDTQGILVLNRVENYQRLYQWS
ncbi:hydroxymethylglutaryl-CoA synthase family protein [Microcoleus asticus]|uniref:Polyketide biosynthesis 3-hydroxy-3-methylglutaryl-ACP synthase PksG n=1 Tax=Microcoleus asticus IPMA8 TaxID=2563858 RepID=A0ABX2CWL5_9CYAN|nr:hydroxymethylglutaryl-CoA synthase family protein [Microcoleus asticus]NQE34726.1 Polyketide biosynthesis 3-hydroxy-3-methylglutaryl-ACP synthase PksG [Microcoleus asticus IPMA8]